MSILLSISVFVVVILIGREPRLKRLIRLRYYYRKYNFINIMRDYFRAVRMRRINYPIYIHNPECINTCLEHTPTWVEMLQSQKTVPPTPKLSWSQETKVTYIHDYRQNRTQNKEISE